MQESPETAQGRFRLKFYATQPSRARLEEDIRAFVSLLKFQRDEQAGELVLATVPCATSLHRALDGAGLLLGLDDRGIDGPWREKLEDPLDVYGPAEAKQVSFSSAKAARYGVHFEGKSTRVIGRFEVQPRGAGFTLGFLGFEIEGASSSTAISAEAPRAPRSRRSR